MDNNELLTMDDFKEELNASFKKIETGDIVTGTVIGINDTNVILDLGSYTEGIINLDEISNDPAFSIKADVAMGETYSALVLREDREGNLILSKKQADDILSWKELKRLMNSKAVCDVKIAQSVNGGVVTYLCGIRGFIPASQLSASYVEDSSSFVGKTVQVIVITVDEEKSKLVLSAKEVERDILQANRDRQINNMIPGTILEGTVDKLMQFGAFIRFNNDISGLVHISQISEKRLKHPGEVLKVGDLVKTKVLSTKDGKLSLSIKAVNEDAKADEDALDSAPLEYSTGESTSTGLGALLAGIKIE